jgi:hypothetical protein
MILYCRHRRVTPRLRSIIQRLNVILPLGFIWSQDLAIISQKTVYLPLNIRSLGPNPAAASEELRLISEFSEEGMATIIPGVKCFVDFVGLIDRVDSFLHVPEADQSLMVNSGLD